MKYNHGFVFIEKREDIIYELKIYHLPHQLRIVEVSLILVLVCRSNNDVVNVPFFHVSHHIGPTGISDIKCLICCSKVTNELKIIIMIIINFKHSQREYLDLGF